MPNLPTAHAALYQTLLVYLARRAAIALAAWALARMTDPPAPPTGAG